MIPHGMAFSKPVGSNMLIAEMPTFTEKCVIYTILDGKYSVTKEPFPEN